MSKVLGTISVMAKGVISSQITTKNPGDLAIY